MKYILIAIFVGTIDILLIANLHSLLGVSNLVIFYLISTLIGGLVLWINYSKFKLSRKIIKERDSDITNKLKKGIVLTQEEVEEQQPIAFVILYIICVVLVLLPGLMTDLLAIFLLLPPITQKFESYFLNQMKKRSVVKPYGDKTN